MKKLIVIGIVILVAVITNPKKADHIDVVKREVTKYALENSVDNLSSGSDFERAGSALGVTLGMKLIDDMLNSIISVNNYLLFSLTKASYQNNNRIIGIGAFGNVWLFVELKDGILNPKKYNSIDENDETDFLKDLDSTYLDKNMK